jgi:hypothetical protein
MQNLQRATNGAQIRHSSHKCGVAPLSTLLVLGASERGSAHGRLIGRSAAMMRECTRNKQGSTERQRARIPPGEGQRALTGASPV